MKTVLIVGGVNDIGLNLAKSFYDRGYQVAIGYHNTIIIDNRYDFQKCDITNEQDINSLIKYCLNKYHSIDILINLANLNQDSSFLDKTKQEFMKVLEVNLVGTFLLNKCYSQHIDNGIIINMSSTDGLDTGSIYSIDYSASKAGIITISEIIARATNNKIYCICPNWIESNTTINMDKTYLDQELTRIGQTRLITIPELTTTILKIIDNNYPSGSTFRIDIKDDKLWMKKM